MENFELSFPEYQTMIPSPAHNLHKSKRKKYSPQLMLYLAIILLIIYIIYLHYRNNSLKIQLVTLVNLTHEYETKLLEYQRETFSPSKYKYSSSSLINSRICESESHFEYISNWFNSKPNVSFTALYRGSFSGDDFISFHNGLDNRSNLLFLFSTTNGNKFGAFTGWSVNYDELESEKMDDRLILFSWTHKITYYLGSNQRKIGIHRKYLISFGNSWLVISDGCMGNTESFSEYEDFWELTGEKHFMIKEFEVYYVENLG